eukprot:364379-Chlamydomonas_euryale.AAC.3
MPLLSLPPLTRSTCGSRCRGAASQSWARRCRRFRCRCLSSTPRRASARGTRRGARSMPAGNTKPARLQHPSVTVCRRSSSRLVPASVPFLACNNIPGLACVIHGQSFLASTPRNSNDGVSKGHEGRGVAQPAHQHLD